MRLDLKTAAGLLIGVVFGVSISVGHGVFAKRDGFPEALPLEDLQAFTEVFVRVKREYVEDVDDQELIESAIQGMLSGLDPHSSYLSPEDFKELKIGTTGEFGGLGIEVGMDDGLVKVIAPIDDTPAKRAGIEAGDMIVRLNDKSVKGMDLSDAVKIMRGKPGTDITLTVVREGVDEPLEIQITRAVIKVKSVKTRMLDPGYAYLRLTQFQSRTPDDLKEAVEALKKESDDEIEGLVVDLRNNPGGVLNAAVGVADAFLNDGLIVYTEGRAGNAEFKYSAQAGDVADGVPIVVLINNGSASASEIVAGALQDHSRAVIMGQQSFGKGSVQTIQELDEGGAIKLTTARYYTPSGRSIQAQGIEPDITIGEYELQASKSNGALSRLAESDLEGHLGNPAGSDAAPEGSDGKASSESESGNLVEEDYALFEALNLLKGLSIAR